MWFVEEMASALAKLQLSLPPRAFLLRSAYFKFNQFKLGTCRVLAVAITTTTNQYFKPGISKIVCSIDFHQVTLGSFT